MSRLEEAVNDADLILECVVEDLEIKKDLLESKSILSHENLQMSDLIIFSCRNICKPHDFAFHL